MPPHRRGVPLTINVRPRRVPRFSWQFAVIGVALATVFALVVAEVSVRRAFPDWAPRTARLTSFWQYDGNYGWKHIPGASGRFASVGFDIAVRINSHGFRGPEISHVRVDGARRVLVLGDSHVWGFGVEEDSTFCRLLEGMIENVEVLNLGVSGYSTDQELLLYAHEGYRYDADIVVLMVSHNDLRGNTRTVESSVYSKPRFLLADGELTLDNYPVTAPSFIRRTAFDMSGKSYLLTRLLRVLEQVRRNADVAARATPVITGGPKGHRGRQAPFPWTPTEQITARLILELRRTIELKQPDTQLLVAFADFRNELGREAAEYFRDRGIPSVALDAYIHPADPAWHLADGLHWTPAGHGKIAEVLADELRPLLTTIDAGPHDVQIRPE